MPVCKDDLGRIIEFISREMSLYDYAYKTCAVVRRSRIEALIRKCVEFQGVIGNFHSGLEKSIEYNYGERDFVVSYIILYVFL